MANLLPAQMIGGSVIGFTTVDLISGNIGEIAIVGSQYQEAGIIINLLFSITLVVHLLTPNISQVALSTSRTYTAFSPIFATFLIAQIVSIIWYASGWRLSLLLGFGFALFLMSGLESLSELKAIRAKLRKLQADEDGVESAAEISLHYGLDYQAILAYLNQVRRKV